MKKNRRKKPADAEPKFLFTKDGKVQVWQQQGRKGMLVTQTRTDAEKFAAWMKDSRGEKLTIAEIGTIEGETAEAHFAASVALGADCVLMVRFDGDTILLDPLISTDWRIPLGDFLGADKDHPIPIAALFDKSTGPNLSKDPRRSLADARVIIGVDVMSQRKFVVYGRKVLEEIAKGGAEQRIPVIYVAIDQETDELERLIALVTVLKGHHDYRAG